MEIGIECLPCILSQVITASKTLTDEICIQKKIIKDCLSLLSTYEKFRYPPEMSRDAQNIIAFHAGDTDPYRKIKDRHIKIALDYYPRLKKLLYNKNEKLYWALKIASVGNSIDLAMYSDIDIGSIIKEEMESGFAINDYKHLEQQIERAQNLLIIGDNAGETVFDRLLIDVLSHLDVTYAVREKAIINDATIEDALSSKMDPTTKIISSGSSVPGTIINECSAEFMLAFNNADIVISKGQGNYETLYDSNREIFFLLKVKCSPVAKELNADLGDYILVSNRRNEIVN